MQAPARLTPKLTKGPGSSWHCETLSSKVFSTPSSNSTPQQRPSVQQGAAGQRRERVSSQQGAATKFYEDGLTRAYHPGQTDHMSNIMYGKLSVDAMVDSRAKSVSKVAFGNAAGNAASKSDRPASEPDRHPDLQRNIKLPPDTHQLASTVHHSEHGYVTSAAPSSDAPAVPLTHVRSASLVVPPTPRAQGESAQDLIYYADATAGATSTAEPAATPRRIKNPGMPPTAHTSANCLPVTSYATDPRQQSQARYQQQQTDPSSVASGATPMRLPQRYVRGGGDGASLAVDVSDFAGASSRGGADGDGVRAAGSACASGPRCEGEALMTADGEVASAPGRSGKRALGDAPSAAPTEMPGILGNYDNIPADRYNRGSPTRASGGGVAYGGPVAVGVSPRAIAQPAPPYELQPRRGQGRAVGAYNPLPRHHDPRLDHGTVGSAPRPASGQFFTMARPHAGNSPGAPHTMAPTAATPRNTEVADAGVPSHRLHELAVTSHNHCYAYARDRPEERRQVGVAEARAGTGPRIPTEQRVCGLSRRAPSVDNPATAARNPVLGETRRDLSPSAGRPTAGRAHLQGIHPASTHHLEPGTLVPDGKGPAAQRRSGKATGARAAQTIRGNGDGVPETAHQALAGWAIEEKVPGNYGRRHVEAPTHEPEPFGLAHPNGGATPKSFPDGAARPGELRTTGGGAQQQQQQQQPAKPPTPSQPPPFRAQESYRSRLDSRSAYEMTRMRGSSSSIFSDLNYPASSAD